MDWVGCVGLGGLGELGWVKCVGVDGFGEVVKCVGLSRWDGFWVFAGWV